MQMVACGKEVRQQVRASAYQPHSLIKLLSRICAAASAWRFYPVKQPVIFVGVTFLERSDSNLFKTWG